MTTPDPDRLDALCRDLAAHCDSLWGDALELEAADTLESRREAYRWYRDRLASVLQLGHALERALASAPTDVSATPPARTDTP